MRDVVDNTKIKRLLATECSQPERNEGKRQRVDNSRAAAEAPTAAPEVSAKAARRRFTPVYKAKIVEEAMACKEPGKIGALLRREGLYSSALTLWRRQYQSGALKDLNNGKRGPKRVRDARDQELEHLRRENSRLSKKLEQVQLILEIQKKVAAMLSNPLEVPETGKNA